MNYKLSELNEDQIEIIENIVSNQDIGRTFNENTMYDFTVKEINTINNLIKKIDYDVCNGKLCFKNCDYLGIHNISINANTYEINKKHFKCKLFNRELANINNNIYRCHDCIILNGESEMQDKFYLTI